jgi:phage protein U
MAMMLSLGDFQFSVGTAAYGELSLKAEYPWATVNRLQNTPQHQAVGKETRSISLRGVVYPSYREAGTKQIEDLRQIAAKMKPQPLMAGNGRYLGRWIVKSISQTDSVFFSDGTPQKQEFTLELDLFDA